MHSARRGFTLVELLVTISIMAVLSVVGMTIFSGTGKVNRDAKRKSDLANLQNALEMYSSDQGYYPNTVNFAPNSAISAGSKTYLNQVPLDPLSGNPQYSYQATPSDCDNTPGKYCTSYILSARLETKPSSVTSENPNGYNFALTPQGEINLD